MAESEPRTMEMSAKTKNLIRAAIVIGIVVLTAVVANLKVISYVYAKSDRDSEPNGWSRVDGGLYEVWTPPGRFVYLPTNRRCVLPFRFNGTTYYECTNASWYHHWCAFHSEFVKEQWDHCAPPLSPHPRCVFPFKFENRTYKRCAKTHDVAFKYWCSYTEQFIGLWSPCGPPKSEPMEHCKFPFSWRGHVYNTCTNVDYATYWCLARNGSAPYPKLNLNLWPSYFAFCSDKTYVPHPDCVFPFHYKDWNYNYCTVHYHPQNKYWCQDGNGNHKLCTPRPRDAKEGCVFPFLYEGRYYINCTSRDRAEPWCSTTKIYSGKYLLCRPTQVLAHPECRFPMYYKGREFNTCTNFDVKIGYWCGKHNHVRSKSRSLLHCQDTTIRPHAACVFPFAFHGRIHYYCTTFVLDDYWCSETYMFEYKWQYCYLPWMIPQASCKRNFLYKGYYYETCTKKDKKTYWCTPRQTGLQDVRSVMAYWAPCNNTLAVPHERCRKNIDFFVYMTRHYFYCTNVDYHRYWCQEEEHDLISTRRQNCTEIAPPWPKEVIRGTDTARFNEKRWLRY